MILYSSHNALCTIRQGNQFVTTLVLFSLIIDHWCQTTGLFLLYQGWCMEPPITTTTQLNVCAISIPQTFKVSEQLQLFHCCVSSANTMYFPLKTAGHSQSFSLQNTYKTWVREGETEGIMPTCDIKTMFSVACQTWSCSQNYYYIWSGTWTIDLYCSITTTILYTPISIS